MSRAQMLSFALMGGLALSTGVSYASPLPQRHEAPRYTWISFDGQWLCRSWSNSGPLVNSTPQSTSYGNISVVAATAWDYDPFGGRAYSNPGQAMTRCTTHWHIDSALRLVSDDSSWTPNPTGAWPFADDLLTFNVTTHPLPPSARSLTPVLKHKAITRVTTAKRTTTTTRSTTGGSSSTGSPSGGFNPWAPVPGHPTYSLRDFAGDPYASIYGVCTWYAYYRDRSLPLSKLGVSGMWPTNAARLGLSVGTKPVVGATVVFQPGVEGAGGTGHVGHVEAVYSGGWFLISEMNFYWNGGGWGRVDYRYVYVRSGVSFIY
jgi:surface antigen